MKFAYLIEPPFNYVYQSGAVTGCDVELARYVFDVLGIRPFEPVETEFAELLPGLATGRWRMTTGLFTTSVRRKTACFSRPIWSLPDGLLVAKGNPHELTGYGSLAQTAGARLAVIRDQVQHQTAIDAGVPQSRIDIFETYAEAASAVRMEHADAYASVGQAHAGFMKQNPDWPVELVFVSAEEKRPAFGSFAFALNDQSFQKEVDGVLAAFLGSDAHRDMVRDFGFGDAEVDLISLR